MYGANDGGLCSFECPVHSGYHINVERCMVEIIERKIIVTDLLNTATPFIRYEIGDETAGDALLTDRCSCGRSLFRIPSVSGRINDVVVDVDGTKVHTEFFTHLFYGKEEIDRFQIVDEGREVILNLILRKDVLSIDTSAIESTIRKRISRDIKIVFNMPMRSYPNGKFPILFRIPLK
jgi:phenylacetate-CoA ligase